MLGEAKLNAEAESLEKLLDEAVELQTPSAPPLRVNGAIQKVRYTHDAMIDLIIANPAISQNELAYQFGYSAGWVSQVIASDAFQAKLLSRTQDLVDPTIRATVEDRFKALVLRSMDILRAKLNVAPEAVSDNLALRTLELSSRALGYGARAEAPPTPPAEVHLHLDTLGERLVGLLRQKKLEAIEGTSTEVLPA